MKVSWDAEPKSSMIEVWLTEARDGITCRVVREDESADDGLDVDSLSVPGAKREMTGWFITQGYAPVGDWDDFTDGTECSRQFKLK